CACLIAVVVLVAVGCTSPKSDNNAGPSKPAENQSTVGITPTTVKIALITADLSLLTQQHLAPDLGDPIKAAPAIVDEINATVGAAGPNPGRPAHKIATAPIAPADVLQRACVQATEEDQPLAVIVAAAVPVTVVQCVAVSHDQLAITMDSWQQ